MNSSTNDTAIVGKEGDLVADGISSVAAEKRSQNTNSSTSCVSSISRKRPFNMLDRNDDTNTVAAAESSTDIDTQALSRTNMQQQKISDTMQTKLDTVEKEKEELKSELTRRNVEIGDMRVELNKVHNRRVEFEQRCIELTQRNQELEIKVKDLTLKNEYNEWKYTAEDIPDSYWISRGFTEEYAERMIEFLGEMKEYTHQLRRGDMRGESPKKIELSFESDLLHDDRLLPHWKEFADALKQYQKFEYRENYGIKLFTIDDIELHPEVMDMLAPALQTSSIEGLILGRNIGSDVLSFAEVIIQSNPHLKRFGWRNNQIESVDDVRRFCKSIKKSISNSFKCLALINCFNGNNLEMLEVVLDAKHQLEALNLNDNGIGLEGARLLANFLASNPPLRRLDLSDNNLNDTDTTILANALQSSTNLRHLYLNNNTDITSVGRRVLLESVFNVSSLNACVASNHNYRIHGLDPDISNINKFDPLSHNREMKIFTMLSATGDGFFNMNCLGDVSYKLIPRVLRLAQKFTEATPELSDIYFEKTGQTSADWDKLDEDTVPITSMFELLRGWAVPSLSA